MANTHIQKQVEEWIRQEWMPKHYHQDFSEEDVSLCSGGTFTFDAVSVDGKIVANISTSGRKTGGGQHGPGKVHKIRSDVFFLLLVKAERTLLLLLVVLWVALFVMELLSGGALWQLLMGALLAFGWL